MDLPAFLARFKRRLIAEITQEDDEEFNALGASETLKALRRAARRSNLRDAFPNEESVGRLCTVVEIFGSCAVQPADSEVISRIKASVSDGCSGEATTRRKYILGDPLHRTFSDRSHILNRIQNEEVARKRVLGNLRKTNSEKVSLASWMAAVSEADLVEETDPVSLLDAETAFWEFCALKDSPIDLDFLEGKLRKQTRYELPRSHNICRQEKIVGFLCGSLKRGTTPKSQAMMTGVSDPEDVGYKFTLDHQGIFSICRRRETNAADVRSTTIMEFPIQTGQVDWISSKDKS